MTRRFGEVRIDSSDQGANTLSLAGDQTVARRYLSPQSIEPLPRRRSTSRGGTRFVRALSAPDFVPLTGEIGDAAFQRRPLAIKRFLPKPKPGGGPVARMSSGSNVIMRGKIGEHLAYSKQHVASICRCSQFAFSLIHKSSFIPSMPAVRYGE